MTKTPFDKIAEGLQEAITLAQGLSKLLPEDMFPKSNSATNTQPPSDKRIGRIEVLVGDRGVEVFEFIRGDNLDMAEALECALDHRDQLIKFYPSDKIKLKIKGAK